MFNPAAPNPPGAGLPPHFPGYMDSPGFGFGPNTLEFATRQLSPPSSFGSARLPYFSMGDPQQYAQSQQAQQQQQAMAPEAFDTEKAKKKMMAVTQNLANMERFTNNGNNSNNNTGGSGYLQQRQQYSSQEPKLLGIETPMFPMPLSLSSSMNAGHNAMMQTMPPSSQSLNTPQIIGTLFTESPLLFSAGLLSRGLSPPSSNAFLASSLPDNKNKSDAAPSLDQDKLKKNALSVMSNLMQAERQAQTQKKKDGGDSNGHQSGGSGMNNQPPAAPRLFAPLEGAMRPPPSSTSSMSSSSSQQPYNTQPALSAGSSRSSSAGAAGQQQNSQGSVQSTSMSTSNNGGGAGGLFLGSANNALLNSNLIRTARLSSGEEPLFDFNSDFPYTFSPGDMTRSLGGGAGQVSGSLVPESPMTNQLKLFPFGYQHLQQSQPGTQGSQQISWQQTQPTSTAPAYQPPTRHAQMAYQPFETINQVPPTMVAHSMRDPKSQVTGLKRTKKDEEKDKKKAKKTPKAEDPNEPRITSKHRGVCWYKRTKKWVVQTKVNGKRVHVGYFDDEEKAAEAYRKAVQGIQVQKALEAKQKSLEDAAAGNSMS